MTSAMSVLDVGSRQTPTRGSADPELLAAPVRHRSGDQSHLSTQRSEVVDVTELWRADHVELVAQVLSARIVLPVRGDHHDPVRQDAPGLSSRQR